MVCPKGHPVVIDTRGKRRCRTCTNEQRNATRDRGVDSHPLYTAWRQMRHRCETPNNHKYKYYGARGIKVCERWQIFANFIEDMGERPKGMTLDRIDNNGHYEPGN